MESQIQEDWHLLVRDIYAFYPLLIKYVDLQRNHWLRHNVAEAEDLYNHVAEIFNTWSKSQVNIYFTFILFTIRVNRGQVMLLLFYVINLQYFMREEQNFISANEIDNMVLIMPTATRRSAVVSESSLSGGGSKVGIGDKTVEIII